MLKCSVGSVPQYLVINNRYLELNVMSIISMWKYLISGVKSGRSQWSYTKLHQLRIGVKDPPMYLLMEI